MALLELLDKIHGHADLQQLSPKQRKELCQEIREFLVFHLAKTGGHLASNLGVVELTVALETVFDTTKDRLVFDVGHQSYVHKLLTGRQEGFDHLRQFGGMAGFPKPGESEADAFVAGHASSSVSIALGMARARGLTGQDYHVVALIGDGATTGGLAYEGLNDAGVSGEPMVVVLNDNEMSIEQNVGGVAHHLAALRMRDSYLGLKKWYKKTLYNVPGGKKLYDVTSSVKSFLKRRLMQRTIFEKMGFTYLGPVDGDDTEKLISILRFARDMEKPVLVHVLTKKGSGYLPAEENPAAFHGVGKFDPMTGEMPPKAGVSFSEAFGKTMMDLAEKNRRLCAITAAMPGGTGLLSFRNKYPYQLFDVGIAEEHAVSMAGGLAKQGAVPVVAIYSTFLQRSYDQIMQDVALLHLHVVFAVDRAGLVGEDGETHHGVFDVGFLRQVPGMTVLCPASCEELSRMLRWAVEDCTGPVAVRYPRGGDRGYADCAWVPEQTAVWHRKGQDVTFVTYGTILENVEKAADILETAGISASIVRLLAVSPLPTQWLCQNLSDTGPVVVVEEVCSGSGIKEDLAWALKKQDVYGLDLGPGFVTHGALNRLYEKCGLDGASIARYAREVLGR